MMLAVFPKVAEPDKARGPGVRKMALKLERSPARLLLTYLQAHHLNGTPVPCL